MFAQKLLCGVSVLFLLSLDAYAGEFRIYQQDELKFENKDGAELVYNADGELLFGAVFLPDSDGLETEYYYRDGKKNGEAVTYYASKKRAVSVPYKDGVKDGKEIAFFKSGQPRYQRSYKNGVLDGPEIIFYENGKTQKQGTYVNGKLNGEVDYFDDKGDTIKIENYENGVKQGVERIIKNKSLMEENNYLDGRLHGTIKKYGEKYLTDTFEYVNGIREGLHVNYSEDGNITETPYHNDMKNGEAVIYYPNKKAAQKTYYIDDLKNGYEKKFNPDGSLISSEYYVNDELSGIADYYAEDKTLQAIKYFKNNEEVSAINLNGISGLAEIYHKYKEGQIASLLTKRNSWYDILWLSLSLDDSELFTSLQTAMKAYNFTVDDMKAYQDIEGNDFEKQKKESLFGLTPLTYAVVEDLPDEVLKVFAAQSQTANIDGKTPLHYAVQQNNITAVKSLFDMQAGNNVNELYGLVLYSLKNKIQPEIIKLLLAKLPAEKKQDKLGKALLDYAVKYSDSPEVMKILADSGIKLDAVRGTLLNQQLQTQKKEVYINTLIDDGFDAKALDEDGNSTLYNAAVNGYSVDIISALVQHGAVWTTKDKKDLLDEAIKRNDSDYISRLKIPAPQWENITENGQSALQYAYEKKAKPEILQYLAYNGGNINHQDKDGNTALLMALQADDAKTAEKLLKLGAKINIPNNAGETALAYGMQNNKDIRLKNEILQKITKDELTAAVDENKTPLWKHLYQKEDWENLKAVLKSVENPLALQDEENKTFAAMLSEREADAKQEELLKEYIPFSDASTMWDVAKLLRADLFKLIPEEKLALDKQNDEGETLLTYALKNKANSDFIGMLLTKGCDVNQENSEYLNALDIAFEQKNKDMVKVLLEHKADVNKVYEDVNDGRSYLMSCERDMPEITTLLLDNGADVSYVTPQGVTTLMAAVQNLNLPLVKFILQKESDVNSTSKEGKSAVLYLAEAAEKYKDEESSEDVLEIFNLLAEHGADLNYRDGNGRTILVLMAMQHSQFYDEFEQAFTAAGGNKDMKDQYDKTAAEYLKK